MRRCAVIAMLVVGCSSPQAPGRTPVASETPAASEQPEPQGPHEPPEPAQGDNAPRADGEPCLDASECASGICEGEGCDAATPGRCAPASRACTRDLRAYCGCDGTTFRTSGSCPGRRFASRGECPVEPS